MLSKFPVTTDRGEYRVDTYDRYRHHLIPTWTVFVYRPYVKTSFFRRVDKQKFALLFEFDTSVNDYEYDAENLIELASDAVKRYEDDIDETKRKYAARLEAIEAFRNWDGNITKEESRWLN